MARAPTLKSCLLQRTFKLTVRVRMVEGQAVEGGYRNGRKQTKTQEYDAICALKHVAEADRKSVV